jgi:RimJ/RimL family protein N-acetyltransferase
VQKTNVDNAGACKQPLLADRCIVPTAPESFGLIGAKIQLVFCLIFVELTWSSRWINLSASIRPIELLLRICKLKRAIRSTIANSSHSRYSVDPLNNPSCPMAELPVIETKRLILRVPQLSDLDRWTEFQTDPIATKYLGGPQTGSLAWRSLMAMAGAWHVCGVSMFSVVEKASGRWMGRIGPWRPAGWPGDEVGWGLHQDAWGKGFATEAAVAAMNYAVDVLGWSEIIHTIDPENTASIRLAQRLGSSNLGPTQLPAPHHEIRVDAWGQSASQWREFRKQFGHD